MTVNFCLPKNLKKVLTISARHDIIFIVVNADVVELADAPDSKSGGVKSVPVRPRSSAPKDRKQGFRSFFIFCLEQ